MSDAVLPRTWLPAPVSRLCSVMALVCTIAVLAGLVGMAVLIWHAAFGDDASWSITVAGTSDPASPAFAMAGTWTVKAVVIVVCGISLWAIWQARAAFAGFARGELFTRATLHALRGFVLGVLLCKLLPALLLVQAAASGWRPGMISIDMGRSGGGFLDLLLLAVLLVLCLVLGHAAKLAEDNAQIV